MKEGGAKTLAEAWRHGDTPADILVNTRATTKVAKQMGSAGSETAEGGYRKEVAYRSGQSFERQAEGQEWPKTGKADEQRQSSSSQEPKGLRGLCAPAPKTARTIL